MDSVRTLLGIVALVLFGGWISLALGPVISVGLVIVVLLVWLVALNWRRFVR